MISYAGYDGLPYSARASISLLRDKACLDALFPLMLPQMEREDIPDGIDERFIGWRQRRAWQPSEVRPVRMTFSLGNFLSAVRRSPE